MHEISSSTIMSEGKKLNFPDRETRQKCWSSRDKYWKCLDDNNEDESKCQELKNVHESVCPQLWVSSMFIVHIHLESDLIVKCRLPTTGDNTSITSSKQRWRMKILILLSTTAKKASRRTSEDEDLRS